MAGELILIADDEPSIRKLIGSFLSRRGYRVVVAADGEEALRLFLQEPPQLLITDLNMPNLSGMELLSKLAQSGRLGPSTATMIISGTKGLAVAAELEVSADDSLTKPIDMAELETRVKAALALAQSRSQKPG